MTWGPFDLTGKATIITGGAMGIGYGIAARFMEAGADVVIADIDGDLAAEKAAALSGPGTAAAIEVDVTDVDAGARMVDACTSQFGTVDVLVNNAGIFPMTPMLQMERSSWQRIIDTNLTGLAYVSQAVGTHMAAQGHGKLINIASIDALHPSQVGLAAYDSSKGGVLMFTKAFALEMAAHGVTVNAIAPGGISTEGTAAPLQDSGMTEEQMAAMIADFTARIPLGRFGDPDDIAKVAVFLASSASDYMTGEIVVVDGGVLIA